jgi:hypothetical protein
MDNKDHSYEMLHIVGLSTHWFGLFSKIAGTAEDQRRITNWWTP